MTVACQLERGEYGPKAIVMGAWSQAVEQEILARGVLELELNQAKGWRGEHVHFLERLGMLVAFAIFDFQISSVEAVHTLNRLRRLVVSTYCRTPLRFEQFPELVNCELEWRPGSESLFSCASLERLFVNSFGKGDLSPFGQLGTLRSLGIANCPARSVVGLHQLQKLEQLRLANLRKLRDLHGLGQLSELKVLILQSCVELEALDEIGNLSQLRELHIVDCREVASLESIGRLCKLERLFLYGSTNIRNGDLSPLAGLPVLREVSFQDRRHYSHSLRALRGLIEERE